MPPNEAPVVVDDEKVESFARRTTFYVNHEWEAGSKTGQGTYIRGQMYVESLEPQERTQKWPIILIHGDYHSSQVIWLTKPDGDPGWASYFVGQGFQVYLVDLPTTRKSNNLTREAMSCAEIKNIKASQIEREVTATERFNHIDNLRWPTALKHDKWPGTGIRGDFTFDRYCASLTSLAFSPEERQTLAQNALKGLLQMTKAAILIGEGTGATASWLAADVVPEFVVGVVAVEPPGPPFCDATVERRGKRKFDSFTSFNPNRLKYGLSTIPLTFSPAVRPESLSSEELTEWHPLDLALFVHRDTGMVVVLQYSANDMPAGFHFWKQITQQDGEAHVRKLTNLSKMRHVIFTGEASSHSAYDGATLHFMKQAGLTVDCGFLERYQTHGNGHLMFLETNSDKIAAHIMRWIQNKAGQVNGPIPTAETEVAGVSRALSVSTPEIIDLDQDRQLVQSPKRARRVAASHASGRPAASHLIDLTDKPQVPNDYCTSKAMHTTSEQEYMLSSTPRSSLPNVGEMPPPPLPARVNALRTRARGPVARMEASPKTQGRELSPGYFDSLPSLSKPNQDYALVPLSNPKPAHANAQQVVPKQPGIGGPGSHESTNTRPMQGNFEAPAPQSTQDYWHDIAAKVVNATTAPENPQLTGFERNDVAGPDSHESKGPQSGLVNPPGVSRYPNLDLFRKPLPELPPATDFQAHPEETGFKRSEFVYNGSQESQWPRSGHTYYTYPTYSNQGPACPPLPMSTGSQVDFQQAAVKQDEEGAAVSQESETLQASHDNYYTDYRFDFSVPRSIGQDRNQAMQPSAPRGNNSTQAASWHTNPSLQQQPPSLPHLPAASESNWQDSPYMWPRQGGNASSSFGHVPRSMPNFQAGEEAATSAVDQYWEHTGRGNDSSLDDVPCVFEDDMSIYEDDDDTLRGYAY